MPRKISKLLSCMVATVILVMAVMLSYPSRSYAVDVTPVSVKMYTTSGTPVYATPDIYSGVVMYLDRFINIRVTGITANGFYRVDIGGTYYIPGPFLVTTVKEEKTAKELALEDLEDFAQAYVNLLEQMINYSSDEFALIDVTGDGVPELVSGDYREIYTFYGGRAVMIYYSANPITLYYSTAYNQLLGKYEWHNSEIWEVYYLDKSELAWGQFKCYTTDASIYKQTANQISRDYTNDSYTRYRMYSILKGILEL